MNKKHLAIAASVVISATSAFAVNFNSGAGQNSGFATSDGVDLVTGSLVRIGVFNLSEAQITANATNYSFLNANFIQVDSSFIGEGNPTGDGGGDLAAANAGLFTSTVSSVNTTGLGIANAQLVYWVFNSNLAATATQHGIFTSTLWTVPAGDGSPVDLSSITTDISNLTTGGLGETLAATTAKILVGGFGPGLNASGGGKDFTLAALTPIPEPSSFAALAGLAMLGFAGMRKRRSA